MSELKIIGVDVFLEKRKIRLHVGILNMKEGKFVFTYDENYFKANNIIPLGPEFPLTQREFVSGRLFPSFEDRIPSPQNPAYSEYCEYMRIVHTELNPFVLLSTIGKKGPSSFIFYPIFEREISATDVLKFRKSLGLTTREFASVFEFSQASLNAFERNRSSGKDILKRLEIIINYPDVASDFLLRNGGNLIHAKLAYALIKLRGERKKLADFPLWIVKK